MMPQVSKSILSVILSVFITIGLYKLTGMDDKYVDTDSITVPLIFGLGGLVLFILLWKFWVSR